MTFKDASNPSGPVTLENGLVVSVDRELCIGCGGCTAIASNTFGLDDEGKSTVLASADLDASTVINSAVSGCPVGAIKVN
ncbi:MAG: ferredoxin [Candidatus Moraniibacteriota bacterium]